MSTVGAELRNPFGGSVLVFLDLVAVERGGRRGEVHGSTTWLQHPGQWADNLFQYAVVTKLGDAPQSTSSTVRQPLAVSDRAGPFPSLSAALSSVLLSFSDGDSEFTAVPATRRSWQLRLLSLVERVVHCVGGASFVHNLSRNVGVITRRSSGRTAVKRPDAAIDGVRYDSHDAGVHEYLDAAALEAPGEVSEGRRWPLDFSVDESSSEPGTNKLVEEAFNSTIEYGARVGAGAGGGGSGDLKAGRDGRDVPRATVVAVDALSFLARAGWHRERLRLKACLSPMHADLKIKIRTEFVRTLADLRLYGFAAGIYEVRCCSSPSMHRTVALLL
jgi:hypothetical protein